MPDRPAQDSPQGSTATRRSTATRPVAASATALLDWLARAGLTARLGLPGATRPAGGPFLLVWPLALLADQAIRGGPGPGPILLRARYLVTVDGAAADLLDLLDRVLLAVARDPAFPVHYAAVDPAVWQAAGLVPRAGLLVDMPVRVPRSVPPVPRVRAGLRVDGVALRPLSGRALGPHGVPLAGFRVEALTGDAVTVTDSSGRFSFAGLPADAPVPLRLSGRGLHFTTEVEPGAPEPVVITCEPEEE